MNRKLIRDMSKDEYQAFVRRLEKRHGADKQWEELPLLRRPGRPMKGTKTRPLKPRSIKLPDQVWKTLASAAKRHHVTASGVVAGLVLQAARREDIDEAIDGLIRRGILTPA
jgi:hypothetical protein